MARKPKNHITGVAAADEHQALDALMEEYTSKLEERVAYESRFFRSMANAMPQIVWTAQPDGKIDYFNNRWYEFSNFELGSLEKGCFDIMHPDDVLQTKTEWSHSLKTGELFQAEYRYFDPKSKSYRWFLGRALPARNEKGEVIKWFGTSTDIDEHKKAQANKDEFIAITSHELKTPLTSLKAFMQVLDDQLRKTGREEFRELVLEMNTQTNRLNKLINDLLEISLLDTGELKLKKQRFNFDKFVKNSIKNLQYINRSHKLVVKGQSGQTVFADKDRLEQAMANLISNAVKYSPDADKVIIQLDKQGENAKVSVTDFGLGIPKQAQASIFRRFYRVQGARYETFSGFGLGLYIANEILKKQGGQMSVKSRVGRGSTFSFIFPARKPKEIT